MSNPDTYHPESDDLQAFIAGRLDDDRCAEIEQHLAECGSCNAYLLDQQNDDSFVRLVRQVDRDSRVGADPTTLINAPRLPRRVGPANPAEVQDLQIDGYRILGLLGRGGMGVVYRAHHLQLKRDVALKVIVAGVHAAQAEKDRFRREAETIARLQHTGIVQIYEVSEQDGVPYLALELVEGQTLKEMTHGEPQPIRWSATMVLQLAGSVHFAHQRSVVHRDLKPGNVLVSNPETKNSDDSTQHLWTPAIRDTSGELPPAVPVAKITDFGVARQLDSDHQLTKTGQAVGTPAYMSPEQTTGRTLETGPPADVYSLGTILYELLTGHPPFHSDDPVATVMAVLEDEPESPAVQRRDLPRDLETICLKCLRKEPARRYASAQELATDLELFLQGEPINARPPGFVGRIVRWARHHPLHAATYLACVCLVALHLIGRFVLHLPLHESTFRWLIWVFVAGWSLGTALLPRVMRRHGETPLPAFVYTAAIHLCFAVAFTLDAGPSSAPVPILLLTATMSALMIPRPSMTWFATAMSAASYVWLLIHAWLWKPENMVSAEHALFFVLGLGLMGATMHLLLRRAVKR